MTIDKYTKFLLTLIAVGIIGINFHLFKGSVVKDAFAANQQVHKIAICDENGKRCANIKYGGTSGNLLKVLSVN